MITAADLWTVSYTVAGIAALAAAAGMMVLRLLAARSVATSLTVVAAVTVAATLAGVVVIAAASTGSFRRFERICFVLVAGSLLLIPIYVMVHPPVCQMARNFAVPACPTPRSPRSCC